MNRTKGLRKIHTERRTANPIKITFAGENTYKINMRVNPGEVHVPMLTRPTPSPRVSERA
jgi:hypothetical protein